jgi:hypothetical protein
MGPQSVREYTVSLHRRYRAASRTEKTRLLDEFCQVTGRHRKSALRRLAQALRAPRGRGGRPPRYGPEVIELLARVWQASDISAANRLAPFLGPLIEAPRAPSRKNWAIIRRLIGYDRYTSRAGFSELRSLYAVLRLYWNFFQPLRKLTAKVRHGARVTKRYDRAQTPYQRLLASGILSAAPRQALAVRYAQLNPVALQAKIQDHLTRLWRLADRPGAAREQRDR